MDPEDHEIYHSYTPSTDEEVVFGAAIRRVVDELHVSPGDVEISYGQAQAKIRDAAAGTIQETTPWTLRRGVWYALAGITLVVIALSVGWRREGPRHVRTASTSVAAAATVYTTGPGEEQAFGLSDGSTVALGEASRLEVPRDFRSGDHPLRLQGSAAFSVRHQAGHAFAVAVPGTVVRVLGTTFMVSRYAADTATLIAVRDGKVTVQANGVGPVVLTAARLMVIGQRAAMRVASINEIDLNLKRGNMNPMLLLYSLTATAVAAPAVAAPAVAAPAVAAPTVPVHVALRAGADSIPVLTVDAVTRMSTFWASVTKEGKDGLNEITEDYRAIKKENRGEYYLWNDMVQFSAKYPSVAVDLQKAGLTAEQWNDDYFALTEALNLAGLLAKDSVVALTAVEAGNINELKNHLKELEALMETSFGNRPYIAKWGNVPDLSNPKVAAALEKLRNHP